MLNTSDELPVQWARLEREIFRRNPHDAREPHALCHPDKVSYATAYDLDIRAYFLIRTVTRWHAAMT